MLDYNDGKKVINKRNKNKTIVVFLNCGFYKILKYKYYSNNKKLTCSTTIYKTN